MPRGKNYTNNNKGVALQKSNKKRTKGGTGTTSSMVACEYGSGCTRPDCIYRHDGPGTEKSKPDTVCLPFLAGRCTFKTGGCRRRHPTDKAEVERLLARYKRTRCRFADECRTEGCLYLHPAEVEQKEPNYIEPDAFPPLGGAALPRQAPLPSAWRPTPTSGLKPSLSSTSGGAPAPNSVPVPAGPVVVPPESPTKKAHTPGKSQAQHRKPPQQQQQQQQKNKKKKTNQGQPQKQNSAQREREPVPEVTPVVEAATTSVLAPAPARPSAWSAPLVVPEEAPAETAPARVSASASAAVSEPASEEQQQDSMQYQQQPPNPYAMYDMGMQMQMPPQGFMGQPYPGGMMSVPPYYDPSMAPYSPPQNGMMYGGMDYTVGYAVPVANSPHGHPGGFNANAKEFVPGGY